jgi:hypothetical protein
MRPSYRQFIFEDYVFDADNHTLRLNYSFDETVHFTETFHFDFDFMAYDSVTLDRACQSLFFMAGVSYYKAYLAPEIVIRKGELDKAAANFFSKTYQKGLGEFFFVNRIDPHTPVNFPTTVEQLEPLPPTDKFSEGTLVGIGGGKDSLVSVEILRTAADNLATWSVGYRPQLTPLVERIGLPHYWVDREWDQSLLELNTKGALNGHIPISAILACAGVVVAVLSGKRDVVVSNEQSANEPTLNYLGEAINHQYSKSGEFEQDYQAYLMHSLGQAVRYYSLLRPLSELHITELFANHSFDIYHDVFSSCNRAFRHDSDHLFWDGTCPKCAFVFLALTPFLSQTKLETLFSGKNLLKDPSLEPTYRQLLGIEGDKPLECVGEIKESRVAMRLAATTYPELATKYQFELPEAYDYKSLGQNHMPTEIYDQFSRQLTA